jgi:hypothetical protein
MDQDQNALSLTALAWDRNGDLRSGDLERLLERLQAMEVRQQKHDQTSGIKKKGVAPTHARNTDLRKRGCEQAPQLATRPRAT